MSRLSRRAFLARCGWAGGGITVLSGCGLVPPLPTFGTSDAADIYTWVQLRPDGSVLFYLPRAEMGQGICTGLTQVVAEELNVALKEVNCQQQDTSVMQPCQMTVGSQSIENYYELTALAAASLRQQLHQRAAAQAGVAVADLVSVDGGFRDNAGRVLTYRQLLQDSEISEEIVLAEPSRDTVQLFTRAPAASRRHIGQMVEQVGIHDVVTGQAQYSRDARLPDMRFGAVARPAQLGAELIAWDADKARQVAGVMAVVEGPDGTPGVVASTPGAAQRGVQALACKWRQLSADQLARVQENLDIDVLIDRNELEHKPIDNGSLASGREAAQIQLNERYDTPMAAHAAMEPRAGLAHFERRDGTAQCRVWTGSQDPWLVRKAVSRALGINDERVIVYNHRIGGAFGGRLLCQASIEAAWLSQAVGEPVKVQWSREEEFACNYVGPQFSTRIEAGLDDTGNIAYWHHRMAGAPILTSSTFIPRRLHWAADLVADPGTQRGTELPYAVTNQRVEFADVRVPMPTGAWRGLGAAPNTFAVEVAMDELASAAALEPLAFRAAHARDPRLAGVLKRLAELISDEDTPPGVAATAYKGVTFVAVAASVDVSSGLPVVTKLWCVHDCGQVVSPDQVLAQIEGNLVWGIGMALTEEFKLADGTPSTLNFDTYLPPRSLDIPPMQIEMIESDAPPSGAAEAAFAPVAAAIANAVSRATGARQRRLPLQPLAAPGRRQG